jgi:hypothetical protein
VLLSPTTLAEMHGIGPGQDTEYAARDRTVRALGWDRVLSDAKELVTAAFVKYSARLLGGTFANAASRIEVPVISRERLSSLPPFSSNAPLRDYLERARADNLASARGIREACVTNTDGELTRRIEAFRSTVQTPGAPALLARLDALPRAQKTCPFILSLREGLADLETQIAASDVLMLSKMKADIRTLPSLPAQPWDHASSVLLRENAHLFTDEFWSTLYRVNDDPYLFRQRTHSWMTHYLIANGFARDDGSYLFDAQISAYLHDVHLFVTTDERVARGLGSAYMTQHFRTYGQSPRIVRLHPTADIPAELVRLLEE